MAVKYGNSDADGTPTASFTTIAGYGANYIKGNADIDSLEQVNVTFNETAQISEEERAKIIPSNIVEGVSILGVAGTAGGGGGGSEVIANPTLTGLENDLFGLQVDDTKYKVCDVKINPVPDINEIGSFISAAENNPINYITYNNGSGIIAANRFPCELVYMATEEEPGINKWRLMTGAKNGNVSGPMELPPDALFAVGLTLVEKPWAIAIDRIDYQDGSPLYFLNRYTAKSKLFLDMSTMSATIKVYEEFSSFDDSQYLADAGVFVIEFHFENLLSDNLVATIPTVKKIDKFAYTSTGVAEGPYTISNLTIDDCCDFINTFGPMHSSDGSIVIDHAYKAIGGETNHYYIAGSMMLATTAGEGLHTFKCYRDYASAVVSFTLDRSVGYAE